MLEEHVPLNHNIDVTADEVIAVLEEMPNEELKQFEKDLSFSSVNMSFILSL